MELTRLAVIVLVLVAKMCRGEIVIVSSDVDNSTTGLADELINIVTSCYKGQIQGLGLAGNFPTKLSRTLSVQHSIPVVVIDNVKIDRRIHYVRLRFWKQLKYFIIEASSFKEIARVMRGLRFTIWWNITASFLILDMSPGCVCRKMCLYVAFQINVLNAKVICGHHTFRGIIFNYNPYTSRAPIPWRRVMVFKGLYRHKFTVFSQKYRENERICVNLDFDKTVDTGGYPTRMSYEVKQIKQSIRTHKLSHSSTRAYWTTLVRTFNTVFHVLNSKQRYVNFTDEFHLDIDTNLRLRSGSEYEAISFKLGYPLFEIPINIVTQFRGHQSMMNKMLYVIDLASWIGVSVVYLVTLIFFTFFVRQALGPALLNLVRLTCNMAVQHLPNNTATRVYMSVLLLCVVVMQGILLCDWAAMLTITMPLRNVNTIQDLEDLDYQICLETIRNGTFNGTNLEKNIHSLNDWTDCFRLVKNDLSVAYVGQTDGSIADTVLKLNLHISSQPVEMEYVSLYTRWEWPLETRFNTILSRMFEASIVEPWHLKCHPIKVIDFSVDLAMKNVENYKSIQLHELAFAFLFLAFGLACSFIVFIIELAIVHCREPVLNAGYCAQRRFSAISRAIVSASRRLFRILRNLRRRA